MKKTVGVVQTELSGIRTGRASGALVENIRVDVYGSVIPLKQMAAIGTPDAKTIEIRPWDKGSIAAVEKAIAQSDLKLAPQRQGDVIRLMIPSLTQDRRQELVKVAKRVTEEGRVAIRNVRQETNNRLKAEKDGKRISEDELRKLTAQVQKMTDQYIAKMDETLVRKEQEINTV